MVDTANLPQINSLMQSYTNYRQALDIIDNGGTIASFAVSGTRGFQNISAQDIVTPPQMLSAIRDQVQARVDDLTQQLAALGVTL